MLGKFLTTFLVIVIALIIIRKKKQDQAEENKTSAPAQKKKLKKEEKDDTLSSDLRLAAYMFLVLMIGLAASMYYFSWQDDHTVLTINLHRDNQAEPVTYQVYKYQLNERSFITLEGIDVTVAASERMEVLGLDD